MTSAIVATGGKGAACAEDDHMSAAAFTVAWCVC